jgi:predicted O-methyltransferase YrrM
MSSVRAHPFVEFGMSFGISTIHLACALRDGGGHLIGSELEPTKAKRARENLAAAGLADLVEIRLGDALETLKMVSTEMWIWCSSTVRSASTCLSSSCWSLT